MKNFTLSICLVILLGLTSFNIQAQERCSMEEYMEEMMKDPEYARQYEENQKAFKKRLEQHLNNSDLYQRGGTIEIPVAVHFPEADESERACLEALAQNQIDILNEDYSATNSDISSWNAVSSQYPGTTAGVANISFCIATTNHPTGLDPELLEGNPCITIGYNFGGGNNIDGNWSGYLNFVIRNIGVLGFSPLGGSVAAGQAVTMDNNAFGSGAGCTSVVPQAPYNLGRTTTHELGHFFNLQHTFNADGGGLCGDGGGDGLADTPEVANSTYGCPPATSVNSCVPGQPALIMNYMDYVNDACMYMFSQDQMTVAEAYVSSIQATFKPNVCQPATPGFDIAVTGDDEIFTCPTIDNQAVYSFDYTTVMSFSETTTFSASGLPAGATATFSPTSLNSDGAFTLTVGNLGGTALGTYTITVTGTSSPSSVTESVDVTLNNNCTEIVCTPYARNNVNLAIADGLGTSSPQNGPPLIDTLNVPDDVTIESMTFSVNLTHTWVGDLLIRLIHPNGTSEANVWIGNCGDNDDIDVTFEDGAAAITCGIPTSGTFNPEEPLSIFNGLSAQGDWQILIADFFQGDTGTLVDWSVEICAEQPLSVSEFDIDDLQVYPNPNNGSFNVGFTPKSGENITIQVHDIRGRAIYTNTYNSVSRFEEVIQLNNAQSGVYLLSISDGPQKVTKKIVVE